LERRIVVVPSKRDEAWHRHATADMDGATCTAMMTSLDWPLPTASSPKKGYFRHSALPLFAFAA